MAFVLHKPVDLIFQSEHSSSDRIGYLLPTTLFNHFFVWLNDHDSTSRRRPSIHMHNTVHMTVATMRRSMQYPRADLEVPD